MTLSAFIHETEWSPGPRARRGAGLTIIYGWHKIADLGDVLIAATPRGICFTGLTVAGKRTRAEARLHDYFPAAHITKDADTTAPYAAGIEGMYTQREKRDALPSRRRPGSRFNSNQVWTPACAWVAPGLFSPLPLDLYGTPFQLQVWRALLDIPFGKTVSYHDVARAIKRPTAPRAVGGAVGDNPVSILVPCHRVIQSNGDITNYGWGTPQKRTLLNMEGVAA